MVTTYYSTLGVEPTVSSAELRRAYRRRATELHPDKQAGRSPQDQLAGDREMQLLNEAWRVLSDPVRRAHYDQTLLATSAGPSPPAGSPVRPAPEEDVVGGGGGLPALVRILPLALLLLALVAILVFTAFAAGDRPEEDPGSVTSVADASHVEIGDCIVVRSGQARGVVPCEGPNDGRVAQEVPRTASCGLHERRVDGVSGSTALCVVDA